MALDYEAIRKLRVLYPESSEEQQVVADHIISKLNHSQELRKQADLMAEDLPEMIGTDPA